MSKFNAPIVFNGDFAKVLKSKLKLNEDFQIISSSVDPTLVATDAPIGSFLINTSTGYMYRKEDSGSSTNWKRSEQLANEYVGAITHELTGFENMTDSEFVWTDGASPKFGIQPKAPATSFTFYVSGKKFTKSALVEVPYTDTEGLWAFSFVSTWALIAEQGFDSSVILTKALCAMTYWDATNNVSILRSEERHGVTMDGKTHQYLHDNFKTRYNSGLALSNFTVVAEAAAPTLLEHGQWGSDLGKISDEDIKHSLSAVASTTGFPVFYLLGTTWRRQAADGQTAITAGGATRIQFNQITGGSGSLVAVGANNDYMLMHMFATNDPAQPVIAICGQNQYTTVALARTGARTEIESIVVGALPMAEFKSIGTVILKTNNTWTTPSKRYKVVEVATGVNYVDFRTTQLAGSAVTVTDHGLLSGLADDDHTQYALTNGTRAITGAQTFNAGILSDTVSEKTAAAGVTLDGVLLKDNDIPLIHKAVGDLFNVGMTAAISSNALVITLLGGDGNALSATNFASIRFGGTSLTVPNSSIVNLVANSNMTLASTATLGFSDGQVERIYVYVINNAGTPILGVSHYKFQDIIPRQYLDTVTAVNAGCLSVKGASSNLNNIIYTDSALTNTSYYAVRLIGCVKVEHETSGTPNWNTISDVRCGKYADLPRPVVTMHRHVNSDGTPAASGTINSGVFTAIQFPQFDTTTARAIDTFNTYIVDTTGFNAATAWSAGQYAATPGFIVPVSGLYSIHCLMRFSQRTPPDTATGEGYNMFIGRVETNGTTHTLMVSGRGDYVETATNNLYYASIDAEIWFNAGEKIVIICSHNIGVDDISTDAGRIYIKLNEEIV